MGISYGGGGGAWVVRVEIPSTRICNICNNPLFYATQATSHSLGGYAGRVGGEGRVPVGYHQGGSGGGGLGTGMAVTRDPYSSNRRISKK